MWILHLEDHFSRFSILYALTSKKASRITYYISLFICHLGIRGILQCDNGRELKGALLLFLKKHNIRLVNGRPCTPRTQRLVEQANALVKDKITKWQAVNGSGNWASALTEICDAINNQTHECLPAGVTPMQLMFFRKPNSRKARIVYATEEEKRVLRQISSDDIDNFCEQTQSRKGKARKTYLDHQIEKALNIISLEKSDVQEDSDSENLIQFR